MNIRKLLAITLLTMTTISQAYRAPEEPENNQSQRLRPGIDQNLGLIEEILHEMHIDQGPQIAANLGNGSPVTTNASPVVAPPVSPILAMLQNNDVPRENEGHVAFHQQNQPHVILDNSNQFSHFDAAMLALRHHNQNQVRVPHNSPEISNDVIVPIAFDEDDFLI